MADPVGAELEQAAAPLRSELVVHCYRMLGSVHEAEDAVQETLFRAWRARESYDAERASLRTWLHRIATNVCLTLLDGRARRPLPSQLGPASDDPEAALRPALDVPWLQPLPDAFLSRGGDPADRAAERHSVRLALIAALQLLPPRQRAVLVLREVLSFSAAEVAAQLGVSPASVNSALQRARATLRAAAPEEERLSDPDDPAARRQVEQYLRAFEAADIPGLVSLLTHDVVLEMPPVPLWYAGRAHYGSFLAGVFRRRGTGWRVVPIRANGQPAFAAYAPREDGRLGLHTVQVLTVTDRGISRNVVFQHPLVLAAFGLPDDDWQFRG